MKTWRILCAVLVLAPCVARAQTPGIVIAMKTTRGGQTTTAEYKVGKNFVRTDNPAGFEIFDAERAVGFAIDRNTNRYSETSRKEMDDMIDRAMQQTLAQLPPNITADQAKELFQQMKAASSQPPPKGPLPEYIEIGRNKVGDWPCVEYVQGSFIICSAEPSLFGLTAEDFDGLRKQEKLLDDLVGGMRPPGATPTSNLPIVSGTVSGKPYFGVVLRRRGGVGFPETEMVTEVTAIRHETFPSSLFELPAGLQKESPAFPIRPGGARTPVIVVPPGK